MSDIHVGNTRQGGKLAAIVVFVVFVLLSVLAGVWLW